MKKLIVLLILSVFAFNAYSQQGVSSFKYEVRVPSIRIGGDTKAKLDSIVRSADTIKFYSGSTKLITEDAAVWSGTSIGLNPVTARTSLGATTVGGNLFTMPNPNDIRYLRTNDDNTISARTTDGLKIDLALTASDVGLGNVTNESKITMFTNPTFEGTTYINGILMPHASSMAKYIGGSSGNGWDRLFLNNNGLIQWGNGTYMYGDNDKISINKDLNFLYNTNILTSGNIGENTRRVNYIYADTVYANYVQFPSPRYASVSRPTFEDWIRVPNVEAVSNTASLGTATDPFGSLRLSGSGSIHFGNTFSIVTNGGFPIFTASRFHFSNNITTDHDIGIASQPVNRGIFRYLETVNRPILGGETAATTNDILDSLDVMRSDAVYGVALADSNLYSGGYQTPIAVDNKISNSLNSIRSSAVFGVALADSNLYNGGYQTPRGVDVKIEQEAKNQLLTELRALGSDAVALPVAAYAGMISYTDLVDARAFGQSFYISKTTIVTGVRFIQRIQGVYAADTADNYNGIALYRLTGGTSLSKVTETANNGDLWKGASYSLQTIPFTSAQTLTPGVYYVVGLYNSSSQTTAPNIYCWNYLGAINNLLTGTNGNRIAGTLASQTSLPATISANTLSSSEVVYGFWLY